VPTPSTSPAASTVPSAAPASDSDEAAIAKVVERYKRAIETKDLAIFRSVRPGLTADEERRLRTAFEQVGHQQIEMRIEHLAITGDSAVVRLARLDVVETAGRTQSSRTTQTLQMAKRPTGWVIVGLGR
jgi:ketosteroid isomerase-like protein